MTWPTGLRVLVQGQGAVGSAVTRLLAEAGATLAVCDIDPRRCEPAASRYGARVVPPSEATETDCDALVPCAIGGLIDSAVAAEIPCRIIAGSANNVLADLGAADVLRGRGIVLAPDFVANAGGAFHISGREVLGWSRQQSTDRARGIRDSATRGRRL